jgi:hypothetical protein
MSILTTIVVSILSAYLAFTNSLATFIIDFLEPEIAIETATTTLPVAPSSIAALPSIFSQKIPDILLKSAEYQQAAVRTAIETRETRTTQPLEALVNIFCSITNDTTVRTTTGSGFFIDSDGIIMTNAHIAQFLLLEETDAFGDATCIIRTGSPAAPQYETDLLYIPPAWIEQHGTAITDANPMGTGERDYALLYVQKGLDDTPLPATFPALAFASDSLSNESKDDTVIAAGYPATALIEQGASADLLAKQATTSISELYTFGSNRADVFSVRGSNVGAEGASGGPIVTEDGVVIGMIATKGDDEIDGEGSLRAITLAHIDRTIREETGFSLEENVHGDIPYRASVFSKTMTPFLVAVLENSR